MARMTSGASGSAAPPRACCRGSPPGHPGKGAAPLGGPKALPRPPPGGGVQSPPPPMPKPRPSGRSSGCLGSSRTPRASRKSGRCCGCGTGCCGEATVVCGSGGRNAPAEEAAAAAAAAGSMGEPPRPVALPRGSGQSLEGLRSLPGPPRPGMVGKEGAASSVLPHASSCGCKPSRGVAEVEISSSPSSFKAKATGGLSTEAAFTS